MTTGTAGHADVPQPSDPARLVRMSEGVVDRAIEVTAFSSGPVEIERLDGSATRERPTIEADR